MKRPAVLLVIGIVASMIVSCYFEMLTLALLILVVVFGAVLLFLRRRGNRKLTRALLVCIGILLGAAVWYTYTYIQYTPATRYHGKAGVFTATVAEYPTVYDSYTSVVAEAHSLSGEKMKAFKVLLYLDDVEGDLIPGQRITITASFEIPESRWNFDKFRNYRAKGIYLTASGGEDLRIEEGAGLGPRYMPLRLTKQFVARLQQILPARHAAILAAQIFGDESGVEEAYVESLRRTGLSHINAVSGMPVAFLVGLIMMLFRRKWGAVIAIPVVILFVLMTGGTASVLRAGLMQILWLLAYLIRRETDTVNSLFVACGLILLFNPYAVADLSLWLSFAATLGIILCGTRMQRYLLQRREIKNRVLRRSFEAFTAAICTTLAAQLFVLPIQVLVFQEVSLISPIANLLVVFSTELAFTCGLIALGLSFIWFPLGAAFAWIPRAMTAYQLWIVPLLAKVPLASISTQNVYILAFIVFSYIFISLWIFLKPRKLPILVCCLSLALGMVVLCCALDRRMVANISVVDTQSGQSVVIMDRDAAVVINCGGGTAYAASSVLSELERTGTRRVSLFVLTDYRTASAGNAETLLAAIPIETLLLPRPLDAKDEPRHNAICAAAQDVGTQVAYVDTRWEYTEGNVTLWAYESLESGADQGRLMVYGDVWSYKLVVPGSIHPENVGYLAVQAGIERIDLIAAGDYYAARMVPPALLRLEPEVCILSSYNGADREIIRRVNTFGTAALETERLGCVRVRLPRLYGRAV